MGTHRILRKLFVIQFEDIRAAFGSILALDSVVVNLHWPGSAIYDRDDGLSSLFI